MHNPPTILFKYASRGRIDRFFSSLDTIYSNIANVDAFHVSVTLDTDDTEMNQEGILERIKSYKNLSIAWGLSESKIHAINRDMPEYGDIIIAMQDDLMFTCYGFDEYIRQAFEQYFPDLDGLLHFPDGDVKEELATIYIAGRPFYNRIGNIYPPQYKSLWCDNHVMGVAKLLDKHQYINMPILTHLCAAYGHLDRDEMFDRQQKDWEHDQTIFENQQANNFYL